MTALCSATYHVHGGRVKDLNGPERCRSAAVLHDKLQPFVEDAALHDDDVGSKMATTHFRLTLESYK